MVLLFQFCSYSLYVVRNCNSRSSELQHFLMKPCNDVYMLEDHFAAFVNLLLVLNYFTLSRWILAPAKLNAVYMLLRVR